MDILKDNVKKIYFKFLAASFGSALITSIYGLVDMAMVGQYHGPDGAGAMAVIAPIWNIIYSFGLLAGIGGSILYSIKRGEQKPSSTTNTYFSATLILGAFISLILWVGLWTAEDQLLSLFGANAALLTMGKEYLSAIKFCVPVFVFTQILSSFLRNDSNPGLATKAVLIGGIFNVAGDYFLVFTLDLGIKGAGIATALGAVISLVIMLFHFFTEKNTLGFVFSKDTFSLFPQIIAAGFSTFFIDIAMGILTMLFNRQIMTYLGTDALAVYGVIINLSTFVQCCAYGVGQAAQPILSQNFGSKLYERIRKLVKYNLITVGMISLFWIVLTMFIPNAFIHLFMEPSASVLKIAPGIMRCYALSFFLLPLNVYFTYYFQSILKPKISFVISISRGMLLSGLLILSLPIFFSPSSLWLAMPITELLVACFGIIMMRKNR